MKSNRLQKVSTLCQWLSLWNDLSSSHLQVVEKEGVALPHPRGDQDPQLMGRVGPRRLEKLDVRRRQFQFLVPGVEPAHDLESCVVQFKGDSVSQSLQ